MPIRFCFRKRTKQPVRAKRFLHPTEVLLFRSLKQRHEPLGSGRGGFDMFDLKRRFRLPGVKVTERPLQ